MIKRIIILSFAFCFLFSVSLLAYIWEGFEKENLWLVTVQDRNGVNSIQITTNNVSEGKYSLAINLDKTGDEQKGFISREGSIDLSNVQEITFDVYTEAPVKLSVGLGTGESYDWFETTAILLKKGWNKDLKVNLTKKEWKAISTGWEPQALPKNLKDTKKFCFIFDQGRAMNCYLDNIRFTGATVPNEAYSMAYEPLDPTKLTNQMDLLENIIGAGWAGERNTDIKKEKDGYILGFKDVSNVDKAAYKVQMDLDWSEVSKIVCKVTNMSKDPCALTLGVQSGNGWKWYEAPLYLVKPFKGQEVVFLLNASTFKSEESGWKYNTYLFEKDLIKCFNIVIYGVYGKKSTGELKLRSFKFLPGKSFVPEKPKK